MRKILTIAIREYRAMVGTKAFVLSMVMMPLLMLGGLIAIEFLRDVGTIAERTIAIVDPSGQFYDALDEAANKRNGELFPAKNLAQPDWDANTRHLNTSDRLPGFSKEKYLLEQISTSAIDDELAWQLSERIRHQDLYAFLIVPAGIDFLDSAQSNAPGKNRIRFHAQDSSLSEARIWISHTINEVIKTRRLTAARIDPALVQALSSPVDVVGMGLVDHSADGSLVSHEDNDALAAIFLPMGVMLLMFMVIFMASQPMLESVLEEKSQRIAEVLLGSANPFQLMSGKLLGTVAGSLTVFAIYIVGASGLAIYRGGNDQIPFELAPWFLTFQVFGVLFYASIFLAVGASVSQLKEAQSMLLPVWMLMMSPMFVWIFIVRDPLGPMATYFSLFPPATPTAMMLRMATGQSIPTWQPVLGIILLMITTLLMVSLAGRIFRVGILWQGKTPRIGEILKWAIKG